MKYILLVVSLLLAIIKAEAFGAEADVRPNFYSRKAEGWFWKETLPEPEEDEVEEPKAAVANSQPAGPKPLSYAWIKQNLPKLHEAAVDNPTTENVLAEKLVEKWALNKASNYAAKVSRIVKLDPDLDPSKSAFSNNLSERTAREKADEGLERIVKKIAKRAGIMFFFQSDCTYCNQESLALKGLTAKFSMPILPISIDAKPLLNGEFSTFMVDQGQAEALGVTQVPALFLADKRTGQQIRVSEGLIAMDELVERIAAAAVNSGLITKEEYQESRFENFETDNQIDSIIEKSKEVSLERPADIAEMVRKALRK